MKRMREAVAGALLICAMGGTACFVSAQEKDTPAAGTGRAVAQGRIPSDAPAGVRTLVDRLQSSDSSERAAAACALGRMSGRAAVAIPSLVTLLSDGAPVTKSCGNAPPFEDEEWKPEYETVKEATVGEAATHALMAIGDAAHDALVDALMTAASWRSRKNAAWALAHRGDRRAMRYMTVALQHDESWQVRAEAAYALFQRGGAGAEVVNALIAVLRRDEAWQVRQQAAFALGHKGSGPVDVVEPLTGALRRDSDPRVREAAAGALWHTAGASEFPALLAALKDEDRRVRDSAADTLGNRAGNAEVELLIAALKDEDERVRRGAKRALQIVKHRSQGTVTNLRPLPAGIPE